jgi:predicted transcriptional regulator
MMTHPKLSKLELQIMEILWDRGACSIREIQEVFPGSKRPAYTTVQTTVYRLLEGKKAVKIVRRISNANIFDAAISRDDAGRRLMDDALALFGGRTKPVMAHLAESGRLTLEDLKEAEETIRRLAQPKPIRKEGRG